MPESSESELWREIGLQISAAGGKPFASGKISRIGGGCINNAYRVESEGQAYFIKVNSAARMEMFVAEAEGLEEIARSRTVLAPRPICFGHSGGASYLVLEYIELGSCSPVSCETLGHKLAEMHRHVSNRHGWKRDNTIGATPQINTWYHDWISFWREHRFGYQLRLAVENGFRGTLQTKGERLMDDLAKFFTGYAPNSSLLHGDLWGGNCGVDPHGNPVIFDPAVYYGDRETDLAMTELFGGFSTRFYEAYREVYPLDAGYKVRKILYNLYHILNHANLFGGGYAAQAESMMDRLLSEIK